MGLVFCSQGREGIKKEGEEQREYDVLSLDLKNVVEKRVFSVYKTKKCVWYHSLINMFQCSKNINMCLVCVCRIIKN